MINRQKPYKLANNSFCFYTLLALVRDMETKDIEAAKRMKNTMWRPAFKEYYEPNDVLRYFEERGIQQRQSFTFNQKVKFIEPEQFFKKEVLKKGLELLKSKKLSELKNELGYIKEIKIPELEKEILRLEQM